MKLGLVSEKRKKRMVFSEPYKIMKPIGSGTAELLAHLTAETGHSFETLVRPLRGGKTTNLQGGKAGHTLI